MKPIIVRLSLKTPRKWRADCAGFFKRRFTVRINLVKEWTGALRDVQTSHKSKLEEFLDGFVDTMLHEFTHIFGPPNLDETRAERMAKEFARLGRYTRR